MLSTYLDAQEHLPYADDSNAVTPMSEENGTIVVSGYYANLGSRHSSYTSHASRFSYTSHGDLIGGIANAGKPMTKESQLRIRSVRPPSVNGHFTDSNQKYHFVSTVAHARVEDGLVIIAELVGTGMALIQIKCTRGTIVAGRSLFSDEYRLVIRSWWIC